MKTKLLALALLAGGSMFAQTRFSVGINIGGNGRDYYQPAPLPYAYQSAPRYEQRIYDDRDNHGYVNQSYRRDFDRDDRDDNHNRGYKRNRSRPNDRRDFEQDNHRENGFSNH